MKAILRWGAGLFGLLLLSSFCHAYYWVTPVTKCPYPQAPNTCNSGFYLVDAWGRVTGPHYYLVPPCQPFQGFLPGPIGQAIHAGNLPHTLLMSKQGMTIGDMPILGQKSAPSAPPAGPGPGQYPGQPMPNPGMQVPYGHMPMNPYPTQSPYAAAMMPPGAGPGAGFGQMQPFGQVQPFGQMQPFNPMQQFGKFEPLQGPRMGPLPQQPPHVGGGQFPSHPFTRSPRDFFMWGETMDDQRARGNRPFPVP